MIKNATISAANLFIEDHGFLTINLSLDYGDSSAQGFGGYVLHNEKFPNDDCTGSWVRGIFEATGTDNWSKVVGKNIRVEVENGRIVKIGHIVKDIWFSPRELAS